MRTACASCATPPTPPIAEFKLRHRLQARVEDRYPGRPGHQVSEPSPARHRAGSGLAGDSPYGARSAGLDVQPRPDWPGEALGTTSLGVPPVLRGRPARHLRPAPPCPPLALDPRVHRRPRTARTPAEPRLTSSFPSPGSATSTRSSGNRRPLKTTPGLLACPVSVIGNEMGRRLRRRPIKKDRVLGISRNYWPGLDDLAVVGVITASEPSWTARRHDSLV